MKSHPSFVLPLVALAYTACSHAVTTGSGSDPEPAPAVIQGTQPAGAPTAAPDPVYRVPVDGLPAIGRPEALVTIVEFTDYQCPFCQRAEGTIAHLRTTYGADLRVVVAEKPLPFHERARPAALAALTASAQGRFEAMHARLFALAGKLDDDAIGAAANDCGVDLLRPVEERSLTGAEQLADRLGVTGTPTFFVDGRLVRGAQPYETFVGVIDERLAAARALVTAGTAPRGVYDAMVARGLERVDASPESDVAGCGQDCKAGGGDPAPVGAEVEVVPVDGAPARGPAGAPVTIVAFSDFECPYCAKAEVTLRALEAAHPGGVRVVFKNRPLPMHAHARLAAIAALAAERQGRFWELHDRMFARDGATLDRAGLAKLATDAGLDAARFARDLDDPALAARVARDEADGDALGVKGTPTFFVNGHRIVGAQPASVFEAAIARPR